MASRISIRVDEEVSEFTEHCWELKSNVMKVCFITTVVAKRELLPLLFPVMAVPSLSLSVM